MFRLLFQLLFSLTNSQRDRLPLRLSKIQCLMLQAATLKFRINRVSRITRVENFLIQITIKWRVLE